MPSIPARMPVCTVVVTVDSTPDVLDELIEHARAGLERFDDYEGFISGALHVSNDATRLVQYLQWTSETEYVQCRDDPNWDHLTSTRTFADHVAAGRAHIDARTYTVVASSN